MNKFITATICAIGVLMLLVGCRDSLQYKEVDKGEVSVNDPSSICTGAIRVKFKNNDIDPKSLVGRIISTSEGESLEIISAVPVFNTNSSKFASRHRVAGLNLWYDLELVQKEDIATRTAIKECAQWTEFSYVGAISKISFEGENSQFSVADFSDVQIGFNTNTKGTKAMPYSDPFLSKQWHYDIGDFEAHIGASINLFTAWEQTTGVPEVIVAINDSGFDFEHEDLKANLWVNVNEIPANGIDDDNNGYIDDIHGFNFVAEDATVDIENHGTHVMGTIAAVTNNGIGVSGIAGGSGDADGVRVMGCQILGGTTNEAKLNRAAINSFIFSADNGALISQNSWSNGQYTSGETEGDLAIFEAIDYFIENAGCDANGNQVGLMKGGIVVFSGGNLSKSSIFYPAAYKPCIAVASSDVNREKSHFSNYGKDIDITAPGGTDGGNYDSPDNILSTLPNNEYGYMSGTSMSAPHVSGIAALIISKFGGPGFTNEMLKDRLFESTNSFEDSDSDYASFLGAGLINASLALIPDDGIAPEKVNDIKIEAILDQGIRLSWKPAIDGENAFYYNLYYSQNKITTENIGTLNFVKVGSAELNEEGYISYLFSELSLKENHSFAIKGFDWYSNSSALSDIYWYMAMEKDEIKLATTIVDAKTDLRWGEAFIGVKTIEIINSVGAIMSTVEVGAEIDSYEVDCRFLASGVYTIIVRTTDITASFKFVKR